MKEPKFKVGDIVKCPKTLYGETEGEIVRVEKCFHELHKWSLERGEEVFDSHGLSTLESDIENSQLPKTFDGTYIRTEFPEMTAGDWTRKPFTMVQKFSGYAYTIETPEINTLFDENRLRLKK